MTKKTRGGYGQIRLPSKGRHIPEWQWILQAAIIKPLTTTTNQINKLILRLRLQTIIQPPDLKQLWPCDAAISRFDGLLKTQKLGIPLHPNFLFLVTSWVSKWVASKLHFPTKRSTTSVKTTTECLRKINGVKISNMRSWCRLNYDEHKNATAENNIKGFLEQSNYKDVRGLNITDIMQLLNIWIHSHFS